MPKYAKLSVIAPDKVFLGVVFFFHAKGIEHFFLFLLENICCGSC